MHFLVRSGFATREFWWDTLCDQSGMVEVVGMMMSAVAMETLKYHD